eukprot:gnl/TRDRNA2_/TRDRNA2_172920_c11_seq3.p1 gnl/TRDRNA2_/TRDRNA2_172920_c11~~gnl/TRDRNA2_/TRDRNA2_172920_c11_seq3.p1  ORF type:complete len:479 (+),score=69.89 gnl/TRDRNA2_/TRDRNA2_172920_c11_seq3:168-1439(+)
MELVADGPQNPAWFVSHYWGTPFADTIRTLKYHAKIRKLALATFFWICTFANNQHNLTELSAADVLQTPFAKAIMSSDCVGTIALMTEKTAKPFERIWCILEDFVTIVKGAAKKPRQLFDFASIVPEGEQQVMRENKNEGIEMWWACERCAALLMDNGDGTFEDAGGECDGTFFPADVSLKAVKVDVSTATASNPTDKENILRLIGADLDLVNKSISKKFGARALYSACCTNTRLADLTEILRSGVLGDESETRKVIDESGSLVALSAYDGNEPDICESLDLLLRARADPNHPADARWVVPDPTNVHSPLWELLSNAGATSDMLAKLIEFRADPTLKEHGTTAVEWCVESLGDRPDIARMLSEHLGDRPDIARMLSEHGASSSSSWSWPPDVSYSIDCLGLGLRMEDLDSAKKNTNNNKRKKT